MYKYFITICRPAAMCFKYFYNEHVLQSAFQKIDILKTNIYILIYFI